MKKLSITDSSIQLTEGIEEYAIQIAGMIKKAKTEKKLIAIFGNGGSAADAQHWVGELVCTYKKNEREPYPAICMCDNSSVITAWSNDYNFNDIFKRQVYAFREQIGLAIGLTTSGKSKNVINGLEEGRIYGAKTILVSGETIEESKEWDLHVRLRSQETGSIQTLTQVMYHAVCEILE